LEAFLVSTALVTVAEMGDKTQLLSFVLAATLRKPAAILAGILVATLANHALAGGAGYLLAGVLSPDTMAWIAGVAFIAFGVWALRPDSFDGKPRILKAGAFATACVAFFVAEMADKTQFATITLAARYHELLAVVMGTTLGMLLANLPAVWLGEKLAQKLPLRVLRITAAVLFVLMGAATLAGPVKRLL